MNFLSLIEAKRDGRELDAAEIREMVVAYTSGKIPDYQMAAFLMATYFRGLNPRETAALTLAMRDSGEHLEFPADPRPLVDKHSTGGVGDKISLVLAPLLACLGFRVPMISGRGLGITGGTLDKLDSIPGFKTSLPTSRIMDIVQEVGCVICGQTERMVPADKGLYALRDVTGTVPSLPLIVASILSKKLAEGLQALILDVKCGTAAFMPTTEKARELASAMVELGNQCGVNTRAIVTNMDVPLGRAAGNWLEVKEAEACLDPSTTENRAEDVLTLTIECAAHLLVQTAQSKNLEAGRALGRETLASGKPLKKWHTMLEAQNADLKAYRSKLERDSLAAVVLEVKSPESGYVKNCDARSIGEAVRGLGGGRLQKDTALDYGVGIDRLIKPGQKVSTGDILARVHASNVDAAGVARDSVLEAFDISPLVSPVPNLLIDALTAP